MLVINVLQTSYSFPFSYPSWNNDGRMKGALSNQTGFKPYFVTKKLFTKEKTFFLIQNNILTTFI